MVITFNTKVSRCYKVQYTDSLPALPENWIDVGASIQASDITMSVTDPGAVPIYTQRFYRVMRVLDPCP